MTRHRLGCALFLVGIAAAYVAAWRVDRAVFVNGCVAAAAFLCGYGFATARKQNSGE